jgi:hypothetical protein
MTPRGSLEALAVTVFLSGCRGLFEIPPQPHKVEIINGGGGGAVAAPQVIQADDVTEVIEPKPEDWCFARARHFNGLVQKRCSDIARETRP